MIWDKVILRVVILTFWSFHETLKHGNIWSNYTRGALGSRLKRAIWGSQVTLWLHVIGTLPQEKLNQGEGAEGSRQGQRNLTLGYCLTGISTRSLSLMFFVVKRSRYDSSSFLVSPFWSLSISGQGEVTFQAKCSGRWHGDKLDPGNERRIGSPLLMYFREQARTSGLNYFKAPPSSIWSSFELYPS